MKITAGNLQALENLQPLAQLNTLPQAPAVPDYTAPLAQLFGARSLLGIRGESAGQQAQTFGQESLQFAQLGLSSIPGVGAWLAAGLGALAGTGEGQRVVNAVGHAEEQVYQAQKSLVQGDVLGAVNAFEGGSSHQQREATFYGAVTSRI